MKPFAFLAALLLAGCFNPYERHNDSLIEQIEQAVQLPPGAEKLDSYARYYASEDSQIVATYVTFSDPQNGLDLPVGSIVGSTIIAICR